MEVWGSTGKSNEPSIPLSSLRLLVPPVQLLSAAMWRLAKQNDVMSYEKLQEFVFMVTEAIPGLMNQRQRAQLVLGLRARLILELCKGSARGSVDSQAIQSYLSKFPMASADPDYRDSEVKTTESTFIALVQSLLKDPAERAYFFQEVFPVQYGSQYDAALHVLLWEMLTKLEKLLPVPDLKQTTTWLGSAPSVEECVQTSVEELSAIFKLYKSSGLIKVPYGPSSAIGSCIMSALSIPPSHKTSISVRLESIHNYANILNPVAVVGAEQYSVLAVYADAEESGLDPDMMETTEVQLQTDFYEEEIVAASEDGRVEFTGFRTEEPSETLGVAKALETLSKAFALRKESIDQETLSEKINDGSGNGLDQEPETGRPVDKKTENIVEQEMEESQGPHMERMTDSGATLEENHVSLALHDETVPEMQQSLGSVNARRSSRLQTKSLPNQQEPWTNNNSTGEITQDPKMSKADLSHSVIAVKGSSNGDSDSVTSIIFTCSQCPFHPVDKSSPPHFHMQTLHTEEYKTLTRSGQKFTPSPTSTDEIFTSIKLFSVGHPEESEAETERDKVGQSDNPRKLGAPDSPGRRKALSCETCGKTFTRTSDVRRHQLTHTGERPFHCSLCERTFQHSWDLAKHQSKHRGAAVSFSCQLCRSSFANLRTLTVHHKRVHSLESQLPFICSICSQSFPTLSDLMEHKKSHVSSKQYVCQQCDEGFDSLLARSLHRQLHQVKRQFKCPHCDKTFTRRSDVKRHLSSHTGERPYQCDQCSKRFSLRFMLMKHLRVHTGERPFQCSHCPKRFTLVSVLARHERMHTGEKPFLCSQCGKSFLSQGELSKHHRSHVDDKPYACPQCDKRFKSKKTQQEHIISHAGARPFPCTYCGKGFAKPYALTRHNLIHTGERPFPCGHCKKSFLTLSEAQLHQRIHTGERPYPCGVCPLKFKSSSELARHKRSHSGQRPAKPQCEQCAKTFPSKVKLRKHMETHREAGEASSVELLQPEESTS